MCSVVSDSFETPRAVARQTLLSMRLPRQEYWGGLPFPSSGVFQTRESSPGLLRLLHWQIDSSPLVPPGKPPFSAVPVLTTFNINLLQIYKINVYPKWKIIIFFLDSQLQTLQKQGWHKGDFVIKITYWLSFTSPAKLHQRCWSILSISIILSSY